MGRERNTLKDVIYALGLTQTWYCELLLLLRLTAEGRRVHEDRVSHKRNGAAEGQPDGGRLPRSSYPDCYLSSAASLRQTSEENEL